jgi:predicted CXXCH cytochrome family protein
MLYMPVVFLSFLIMLLPCIAIAKSGAVVLKGDSEMCLGCHANEGMIRKLKDNTTLSVYVNAAQVSGSVHSFLGCNDCHKDISMANHPADRTFKNAEDFRATTAKLCVKCHSIDTFTAKRMHYQVITQAKAPPCVECHSAHSVQRVAAIKASESNNDYCLGCHKKNIRISSTQSTVSIDGSQLHSSMHKNHDCASCHTGFSKETHPLTPFANKRDHSVTLSGTCMQLQCHADKTVQVAGSIHYSMLKEGNLNAPVCTDCHGFHAVRNKSAFNTMAGVPCKNCHQDVFTVFAGGVHGKARLNGNSVAPLCSSCHHAHDIKATVLNEGIKYSCLGCHKRAVVLHKKWLPEAALHLDSVSCAVCHSPDAGGMVFLRLVDKNTGKSFTESQVIKLLGENYPKELIGPMIPSNRAITEEGLYAIVKRLNAGSENVKVTLIGSISVSRGIEAHNLTLKQHAVKECEQCHSAKSDFFSNVSVAVIKDNGEAELFKVDQKVLGSTYSVLPANQFYALGSTRLKMLDIIGILLVVVGVSFPITHLLIRKVTAPIRKKREEEHK